MLCWRTHWRRSKSGSSRDLDEIADFNEQFDEVKDRLAEFNMVLERQAQTNAVDDVRGLWRRMIWWRNWRRWNRRSWTRVSPRALQICSHSLLHPKQSCRKRKVLSLVIAPQIKDKDDDFVKKMQDWSKFWSLY